MIFELSTQNSVMRLDDWNVDYTQAESVVGDLSI